METKLKTLANGLRIIAINQPASISESIQVWINVGAKNESEDLNGISHLLEHMLFNGTKKRSAKAFLDETEDLGTTIEGASCDSSTYFSCSVMKSDTESLIELFADMIGNPILGEKELLKEKPIVLKEMFDTNDNDKFSGLFNHTAYGIDRHKSTIIGTPKSVERIIASDLQNHWEQYYTAPNMVISACGGVAPDVIFELCEKYFSELNQGKPEHPKKRSFEGGKYIYYQINEDSCMLSLNFDATDKQDSYAALLLSYIIGQGISSRLMQKIREEKGLVYSISSCIETSYYGDIFDISAICEADDIYEILKLICQTLEDCCQNGFTEQELARAKKRTINNFSSGSESNLACCLYYGHHLLLNNKITTQKMLVQKVNDVSLEELLKVARIIFSSSPILVIQAKNKPDDEKLKNYY